MISELSKANQLVSDNYFAICPISLKFERKYTDNICLYFKKDLEIISSNTTSESLIQPNNLIVFNCPTTIKHFKIKPQQDMNYQWSLQTLMRANENGIGQIIESQQVNNQNQWANYEQKRQNSFQDTIYFNKMKCELNYLVVKGSNNQHILKSMQVYFINKSLGRNQRKNIQQINQHSQKQIAPEVNILWKKFQLPQDENEQMDGILTQSINQQIHKINSNLFKSNNSYLKPKMQYKISTCESNSLQYSNTEQVKNQQQHNQGQQQKSEYFDYYQPPEKMKLSVSDLQIAFEIENQVKQLQTEKQTYQLCSSQNFLQPLIQKQQRRPIPITSSLTFFSKKSERQYPIPKNKNTFYWVIFLLFFIIFIAASLLQTDDNDLSDNSKRIKRPKYKKDQKSKIKNKEQKNQKKYKKKN